MPPLKLDGGVVVEALEDGRLAHTFRQSTLKDLSICPERGRAVMADEVPKLETDAACVGTATHAGIEKGLLALRDGDGPLGLDELTEAAQDEFSRLSALPEFTWVKYKEPAARRLISSCLEVFYDQKYHMLQPLLVEHGFGPIVIYEDDERIIQITGTIDLFDALWGAGDWKTTGQGRKYRRGFGGEAWMLDRWDPQPSVYLTALLHEGYETGDGPWPFTFYGFELGREVELIEATVLRRPQDIAWLTEQCRAYATLVEARIKPWPKQDNHALCSPTWCDHWDSCKGAHYVDVEWPLRGPNEIPRRA